MKSLSKLYGKTGYNVITVFFKSTHKPSNHRHSKALTESMDPFSRAALTGSRAKVRAKGEKMRDLRRNSFHSGVFGDHARDHERRLSMTNFVPFVIDSPRWVRRRIDDRDVDVDVWFDLAPSPPPHPPPNPRTSFRGCSIQ